MKQSIQKHSSFKWKQKKKSQACFSNVIRKFQEGFIQFKPNIFNRYYLNNLKMF